MPTLSQDYKYYYTVTAILLLLLISFPMTKSDPGGHFSCLKPSTNELLRVSNTRLEKQQSAWFTEITVFKMTLEDCILEFRFPSILLMICYDEKESSWLVSTDCVVRSWYSFLYHWSSAGSVLVPSVMDGRPHLWLLRSYRVILLCVRGTWVWTTCPACHVALPHPWVKPTTSCL